MLSQETLRDLGNLDRDRTERRVRAIFERWAAGDVEGVIGHMAPDIVLPSVGAWTGVRPPLRGRERVGAQLRKYAAAVEIVVSLLHEVVIDGDRAVIHRTSVGRRRRDGRRYQCDFISFFRFRDGLLVEFSDYPDAAWREVYDEA